MRFNSFIKAFLPQDKVFYGLFEQVADNLTSMASDFRKALQTADYEERKKLLLRLEDGEHDNDELTHQIFVELGQNFITPFDREDIHYLAIALDDVADFIYASSKKILNYNIDEIDGYMKSMVVAIDKSVSTLSKAIKELRNMKKLRAITEACVQINSYENEADELLEQSIKNLFSGKYEALEVVKLKDIYQDMEVITDKCEDASNVIETIIIKYA
jgi:predicted phosphate transport protein (TIGR00153 family)